MTQTARDLRPGRGTGLDTPLSASGRRVPRLAPNPDAFGEATEGIARFMGTPQFLVWMTLFCAAWLGWNTFGPMEWRFDSAELGFTALTLMLSLQASYAAPLLLLAQNRQDDRDKVALREDRDRAERNLAVALLLQPDVLQEGLARPVGEAHLPVEEVGGHHLLGATAGEPAQVDQPGRDDPARVHGRHPRHRDEDALLAGDLDHEAGGERGCGGAAVQHDDVAQPSQAVAEGVEDVQAQQAGHEDLGGAHRPSLRRAGPRLRVRVRRTAARPGAGPGTMGPCRS